MTRSRRRNPLFADRRTAAAAAVTTVALAVMELVDARTGSAPGDDKRDEGTIEVFSAAMAAALTTTAVSLLRRNRRPLPRGRVRFAAGLGMVWSGIAVNRWARRTLGVFYRPVVTILDDHQIVSGGPYRFVRHPMYLGGTLICAGNAVVLATMPTAAAWVLPPLALVRRIVVEEAALGSALGDRYEAYAAGRSRLVPGLW